MVKRKKAGEQSSSPLPGGRPETPTGITPVTPSPTTPASPLATPAPIVQAGSNMQSVPTDLNPTSKIDTPTKVGTPPLSLPVQPPTTGLAPLSPQADIKSKPLSELKDSTQPGTVKANVAPETDKSKNETAPQVQETAKKTTDGTSGPKDIQVKPLTPNTIPPQTSTQQEQKITEIDKSKEAPPTTTTTTTTTTIKSISDTGKNSAVPQTPAQLLTEKKEPEKKTPENAAQPQAQNIKDTAQFPKDLSEKKILSTAVAQPLQVSSDKNPVSENKSLAVSGTPQPQNLADKKEVPKSEPKKENLVSSSIKTPTQTSSDKPGSENKTAQPYVSNPSSLNIAKPETTVPKPLPEKKDLVPEKEKAVQSTVTKPISENTTTTGPEKQVSTEKQIPAKGATDNKKPVTTQGEKPPTQIQSEKIAPEKNSTKQDTPQVQVNKETDKSKTTKPSTPMENITVSLEKKGIPEDKRPAPISQTTDITTQPVAGKAANDQTKPQNEKSSASSSSQKQPLAQPSSGAEKSAESTSQKQISTGISQQKESPAKAQPSLAKSPTKPSTEGPPAASNAKPDSYSDKLNKSNKTSANNEVSAGKIENQKSKAENKTPASAAKKTDKKEVEQKATAAASPAKDEKTVPVSSATDVPLKAPLPQGTETSKKDGTKVNTVQTQEKKGNKSEEKAEGSKPKDESLSNPPVTSETTNKKPNIGTAKKINEKSSNPAPKKSEPLSQSVETGGISNKQSVNKGKEVTSPQPGNTSKASTEKETLVGPTSEKSQGTPKNVLSEVKVVDANNKDKGPAPENKTIPKKSPTTNKAKADELPPKTASTPSNEQLQNENASKKAKAKNPKDKGTPNSEVSKTSTATKENQQKVPQESTKKDTTKTVTGAKVQETSNLLGLVQEVINGIGKENSSSTAPKPPGASKGTNDTEQKSAEDAEKKSKRSRNKKKPKANEGEVQAKQGDTTKTNKDSNVQGKSPANIKAGNEQQKKKTDEGQGKSEAKTKKEKGSAAKTAQSGEKPKQTAPRSKTNQSSATDVSNLSPSLNDQKAEGRPSVNDSKESQAVGADGQPKKKRKRRKNKGKQATNGEKGTDEGAENNNAQTSEATDGIKKKLQ